MVVSFNLTCEREEEKELLDQKREVGEDVLTALSRHPALGAPTSSALFDGKGFFPVEKI